MKTRHPLDPQAIDALEHRQTWRFDGRHYTRTLAAWRERLETLRAETLEVLGAGVTTAEAQRRWHRWRTFLIAMALALLGEAILCMPPRRTQETPRVGGIFQEPLRDK
jgi:cyclopropane fatty-acyl-phospholipid synthase-like methyltransferase